MNIRNLTLEDAAAICYPETLSADQLNRLYAIGNAMKAKTVEQWHKCNENLWVEICRRLLVPTTLTHEEVIQIMERVL